MSERDDIERDEKPRRKVYHCGGRNAYRGPCGAEDCGDCYPGTAGAVIEKEEGQ